MPYDLTELLPPQKYKVYFFVDLKRLLGCEIEGACAFSLLLSVSKNFKEPFYFFLRPCNDPRWEYEDSFIENLGIDSNKKILKHLSTIGQRLKGEHDPKKDPNKFLWYWKETKDMYWFQFNPKVKAELSKIGIDMIEAPEARLSQEHHPEPTAYSHNDCTDPTTGATPEPPDDDDDDD